MTQNTSDLFVSLVNVTERAQNVQKLAAIWGDIRRECEDVGVEIEDSYAVLGAVDFLVIFSAPDRESAFQAALIIERHGFDSQTMELTPTDRLSELVADI
jgi:uncharacterized protein with GYD domain